MTRIKWYEKVSDKINSNLEGFYEAMYDQELRPVGGSFRANPCPNCGHNDCCTISDKNSLHCFSCDWKGTHINAYIKYVRDNMKPPQNKKGHAIKKLEEWSGIKYPRGNNEKEIEFNRKYARIQEIKELAVEHFSKNLLESSNKYECTRGGKTRYVTPLQYQLDIRKHEMDSIKMFNVMFIEDYLDFWNKLSEEYSKEEIKDAKIWFPEGTFVYPYRHPTTGDILRMNMKNPFESSYYNKSKGEEVVMPGMSSGSKVIGFSPSFSFDKDAVIVEGEDDAITVYEEGFKNIMWIGGNLKPEQIKILERHSGIIFTAFDNDDVGHKYHEIFQDKLPEKDVRALTFDADDIDDYYKKTNSPKSIESLMKNTKMVPTDKFKVKNDGIRTWAILNRHKKLEFNIKSKGKKNMLIGEINFYTIDEKEGEKLSDRKYESALEECPQKMKPLNFELIDSIQKHLNENLEDRDLDELIDIYYLSSYRAKIIRCIAYYLNISEDKEKENIIDKIKANLDSDTIDTILKELNDYQNEEVKMSNIPVMKVSQHFNSRNGDGYFYFTRNKRDGDTVRRIPFLLRNDGVQIRLDLLKRKDPQCLLLIDNKYELPYEVPGAISKHQECSLWEEWADLYVNGKIRDEELDPYKLIKTVESYLKSFYYFEDETKYKVLALYIFGTYFYELLGCLPYMFFNGQKGSGKSTLDYAMRLFCFNAKLTISITDAALFRMMSFEGGTIIMDEMENLTSRTKTSEGGLGPVLKGGYTKKSGDVLRHNSEKGVTESFNVYCPKVISNIFGLEDIIGDRCIEMKTFRVKPGDGMVFKSPETFFNERLDEVREVTSKMCLCALKHFLIVNKIKESPSNTFNHTNSPRTAEIMEPMLTMARFVDLFASGEDVNTFNKYNQIEGEFERGLIDYHDKEILKTREAQDESTPEGIIKAIVPQVAYELIGSVPTSEKYYTISDNFKYKEDIEFDKEEGWFEINTAHFKVFIESHMLGETAYSRNIVKWVKTVFNMKSKDVKRRSISLTDEDFIREWNGSSNPKVYSYRFYFKDFVYNQDSDDSADDFEDDIKTDLF